MRYLTIKRHKSLIGWAVQVRVYIEDPFSPELDICGVPCRLLGMLKNNQEKSFHTKSANGKQCASNTEVYASVESAEGGKCDRCWCYSETVGANAEHPTLCARCAAVVSKL